jgi:hypothetical protein
MKMQISIKKGHVFWGVTFFSLVHTCRRFRSTYLHLHLSTPVLGVVYYSEAGPNARVFMCFVFIWEQRATRATYNINWLVFITEMKRIYSAVRTGYWNKAVCASSVKGYGSYNYAKCTDVFLCNVVELNQCYEISKGDAVSFFLWRRILSEETNAAVGPN